jgi:DNA polymerase-3 subunit alpha
MSRSMRFYPVHTHCTFSFGDGCKTPKEHAARQAELGYTGGALTDHGNIVGHAEWERELTKAGLHPSFGCELYTAPPNEKSKWHQTVVAENATGYRNLCELVTASWKTLGTTSKSRYPTCHSDMLAKHSAGIISTSGCADSLLACTLLGGKSLGVQRDQAGPDDLNRAKRVISWFKAVYPDSYYLEVQRFPELQRTRTLNSIYAELSAELHVPLVATADIHYLLPEQNKVQVALHAALRGGTVETQEASWEYDIRLSYPLSDKQIGEQLMATGLTRKQAWTAICNSEEIGQRCQVTLPKSDPVVYPGTMGEMAW